MNQHQVYVHEILLKMIKSLPSSHLIPLSFQDWSLEELCAVCGIMNIPYVVVVQPHLLRDKGSVRLRRIQFDSHMPGSSSSSAEKFVDLNNLAATILAGSSDDTDHPFEQNDDANAFDSAAGSGQRPGKSSMVECIYVEADHVWGSEKQITKSEEKQITKSEHKNILKALKYISQRSEAYLESMVDSSSSQGPVVVAAELPFWVLREFGSTLMRNGESTATRASIETTEKYPKHKRVLKTLSIAIDATMKKYGYWDNKGSPQRDLFTLFLYSKMDDRFDMISLGDEHSNREGNDVTGRRKNDRKKG